MADARATIASHPPATVRGARAVEALGVAGTAVFLMVLGLALFAPWVSPLDPLEQDLTTRFAPPFWMEGGSAEHLLGTDQLGRDTLSRLIYGARMSMAVALSAVGIAAVVGTGMGLLAGFAAGSPHRGAKMVDRAIMALTSMALAIPGILLAIAVAAVLGTNALVLILILSLFGWVVFARLTRSILLSLHDRAFVEAATVLGAGRFRTVFRHMLPQALPQIIVVIALQIGFMVLVESSLGYLGLGIQPPTPTWGNMVAEGRAILGATPWVAIFSGLAITVTVLAINFMSDLIRARITAEQGGESAQEVHGGE